MKSSKNGHSAKATARQYTQVGWTRGAKNILKTSFPHIRVVSRKKTAGKNTYSQNGQILKRGQNDHFAMAIVRQYGQKWNTLNLKIPKDAQTPVKTH